MWWPGACASGKGVILPPVGVLGGSPAAWVGLGSMHDGLQDASWLNDNTSSVPRLGTSCAHAEAPTSPTRERRARPARRPDSEVFILYAPALKALCFLRYFFVAVRSAVSCTLDILAKSAGALARATLALEPKVLKQHCPACLLARRRAERPLGNLVSEIKVIKGHLLANGNGPRRSKHQPVVEQCSTIVCALGVHRTWLAAVIRKA